MFFMNSLRAHKILGINSRNLDYIFQQNRRRYYHFVDNKLTTKELAIEAGIPVPELYGVIRYQEQLKSLAENLDKRESFVIKPAQGSGGGGIVVVKGRDDARNFIRANGQVISLRDLRYHCSNIVSGLYALNGMKDQVVIERCIENDAVFAPFGNQGVPDIRLIVYKGVPAMAMLRLPTRRSNGRANLHAGGIGTGICLASGQTIYGLMNNRFIDSHIDTGEPLSGHNLPFWDKILEMGASASAMTPLGYVGVDIVLDRDNGPVLLEMNARPGIAIQVANRSGLRRRLEKIDEDISQLSGHAEKISYAKETFAVERAH